MLLAHLPENIQVLNVLNSNGLISSVVVMVQCPKCKKELTRPNKTWKYRELTAEFYVCNNCGAKFREYLKNGKHSFTLMFKDGHYRKV